VLKDAYTTKEILGLLGLVKTSVLRRATREHWQSRPRQGRGGGKEWLIASMPEGTRLAVRTAEERRAIEQEAAAVAAQRLTAEALPAERQPRRLPAVTDEALERAMLDDKRRERALAKADLVSLYVNWQQKNGSTVREKKIFVQAYLDGKWPQLLAEFGKKISWKSLERWKLRQSRAGSILALADKRGIAHKGRTQLCEQHRTIILGQLLNPNALNVAQCARPIQKRCKDEGIWEPSEPTIRRFVRAYASECYGEYTLWREGKKAWNDKCAVSILRDWSLVGVGDVVIADGHTLNFESVEPETGKPKRMTLLLFYDGASNHPLGWEIMPTENTACISSAFRRTCLLLGKYPRVVYLDNGKAFRAKFFAGCPDFEQAGFLGLYRDLGCEVIHAWPYHGQSKTIERFFGSMHDMEVFIPSYTGNSIDAKPARMKRGELLHRKLYEKMGNRPLTLEETHRAVARWFAEYAMRPQYKTHLRGRTPAEVYEAGRGPGVDAARLTLMMLQKEIKTISKDGIKHRGRLFWHEALANRRHPVVIRYDDQLSPWDVLVYTLDGDYLCQARDREYYKIAAGIHPAAKALGTAEQQQDFLAALELRKHQEKEAGAGITAMLENIVLPEAQRMQDTLALPVRSTAIDAAVIGQSAKKTPFPTPKLSAADIAAIEAINEKACADFDTKNDEKSYKPAAECRFKSEVAKYDYLHKIKYHDEISLVPQDQAWFDAFEASPRYATHYKRRYDDVRQVFEQWKAQ
jgi:putative transposase